MGVARSPFRLPLEIAMNKPTKAQANARPAQNRPAQGRPAQQRNVQQQAASEAEYFNLHSTGCGYLSRVRWVTPNQRRGGRTGDSFLACAINALRGAASNPNYTYFDLRVSGAEAIAVVEQLKEAVDQNRKVFVAFKLGDFYVDLYERDVRDQDGRKTGEKEPAAGIKGRLLLVTHAKVDGETVYSRKDTAGEDHRGDAPSQASGEAAAADDGDEQGQPGDPEGQGEGQDEPPQEAARQVTQPAHAARRPATRGMPVDRTRVRGYAEAIGAHG
jgi:hypothetical protein